MEDIQLSIHGGGRKASLSESEKSLFYPLHQYSLANDRKAYQAGAILPWSQASTFDPEVEFLDTSSEPSTYVDCTDNIKVVHFKAKSDTCNSADYVTKSLSDLDMHQDFSGSSYPMNGSSDGYLESKEDGTDHIMSGSLSDMGIHQEVSDFSCYPINGNTNGYLEYNEDGTDHVKSTGSLSDMDLHQDFSCSYPMNGSNNGYLESKDGADSTTVSLSDIDMHRELLESPCSYSDNTLESSNGIDLTKTIKSLSDMNMHQKLSQFSYTHSEKANSDGYLKFVQPSLLRSELACPTDVTIKVESSMCEQTTFKGSKEGDVNLSFRESDFPDSSTGTSYPRYKLNCEVKESSCGYVSTLKNFVSPHL